MVCNLWSLGKVLITLLLVAQLPGWDITHYKSESVWRSQWKWERLTKYRSLVVRGVQKWSRSHGRGGGVSRVIFRERKGKSGELYSEKDRESGKPKLGDEGEFVFFFKYDFFFLNSLWYKFRKCTCVWNAFARRWSQIKRRVKIVSII